MGAFQVYIFLTICILQVSTSNNQIPDLCIVLNQDEVCSTPTKTFTMDRHFFSYLGLRYAEPPIGHLRFQAPRKFIRWIPERKIDPSIPVPFCPQWDYKEDKFVGDEDCLFLNVYTPRVTTRFSASPVLLPVLVFIHGGGGFSEGGASYYGPHLLMDHDLILVTVQYRLGVFGFLSSQTSDLPGNYGMLDIIMSLKWVRENIAYFGGDSQHVTVMGKGSGAAAVSLLVVSPLAKGLFHKAIVLSGSALCSWAVQENAKQIMYNLSAEANCSAEKDDASIINCLKKKPAERLIEAQKKLMTFGFLPVLFAPVIDGDFQSNPFLPSSPKLMYDSANYNPIPLMVGETTHEGLTLYDNGELFLKFKNTYHDCFVPELLQNVLDDPKIADDLWESVKNTYFRDTEFLKASEVIPPFVEFFGDIMISSCIDQLLRAHLKNPVYYYVYAFRKYVTSNRSFVYKTEEKLNPEGDVDLRAYFQGAAFHGDDLSQLFLLGEYKNNRFYTGTGRFPPSPPLSDFNFTASMLCLFTSFITLEDFSALDTWNCRNPLDTVDHLFFVSRNGSIDNFRLPGLKTARWPPYNRSNQQYLYLNKAFSIRSKYRHRELAVLNRLMQVSEQIVELNADLESASEPYFTIMWVLVAFSSVLFLAVITLLVSRLHACGNYELNKLQ